MWNPFRRRAAREDAILAAFAAIQEAFRAQQAQNEAFREFLSGFRVTEPPRLRDFDDAADISRQMERHIQVEQARQEAFLPPGLRGKAAPEQWGALLDRLELD